MNLTKLISDLNQEKISYPANQFDRGWNKAIDYILLQYLDPIKLQPRRWVYAVNGDMEEDLSFEAQCGDDETSCPQRHSGLLHRVQRRRSQGDDID
jgi:hypothetical protein